MGALTDKCRLFWLGLKSSIPSGWEEDVNYREKYLEGVPSGGTAGTTGGGNHGHTGVSHMHTGVQHAHTFSVGQSTTYGASQQKKKNGTWFLPLDDHSHANTADVVGTVNSAGTSVAGDNVSSLENASPFSTTAFVIKPTSGGTPDIPQYGYVFADAAAPSGFVVADGTGGTIDLDGRFLRGCTSAATQGGADYGASANLHSHAGNPAPHTHSVSGHDHASRSSGNEVGTVDGDQQAVSGYAPSHAHDISFNSGGADTLDTGTFAFDDVTNKPEYYKLLAIMNNGSAATPNGVIVGLEGSAGDIPSGFAECDGTGSLPDLRGLWIEGCTSVGSIGDPGLSVYANSHSHSSNSHTATVQGGSHSHVAIKGDNHSSQQSQTGTEWAAYNYHTHPITVGNATLTFNAAVATTQTADGRVPYRRLRWIKKVPSVTTTVSLGAEVGSEKVLQEP